MLIEWGADVNVVNDAEMTPLHYAGLFFIFYLFLFIICLLHLHVVK